MFLSTATVMKMPNMPQIAVECAILKKLNSVRRMRGDTGNKYVNNSFPVVLRLSLRVHGKTPSNSKIKTERLFDFFVYTRLKLTEK